MITDRPLLGRERIAAAFAQAGRAQSAALMPYFTLGYPDPATSLDIITAIAPASDLLELGVPFSDPIADGPIIQNSTQIALDQGMTSARCLHMIRTLRDKGITTPVMLMGYTNPILAYGVERYVADAAAAGADGFIVPDLPPEEAGELDDLAQAQGLSFIYFLAPTSTEARLRLVAERATGFIYLVSISGITGTKEADEGALQQLIGRIRDLTDLPLAVGFGINTPARAAAIGALADGVIVGSALIKVVDAAPTDRRTEEAAAFVNRLRGALQHKG